MEETDGGYAETCAQRLARSVPALPTVTVIRPLSGQLLPACLPARQLSRVLT